MPRQCNDPEKSTEFSNWLRNQEELPSGGANRCYVANNVDFMWHEYKASKWWAFIEEKRYGGWLTTCQEKSFAVIHNSIRDPKYRGFFVVVFEKTTPDDGWIEVNRTHVIKDSKGNNVLKSKDAIRLTRSKFMQFLRFEPGWDSPEEKPVLTEKAQRYEDIISSRYD